MTHLEPKHRRLPPPLPGVAEVQRRPENLVAEIVDQITEKQAKAAEIEPDESQRSAAQLQPAGTPYQAVLSCSTDEPGAS
jgi:cell division septation protein DedD